MSAVLEYIRGRTRELIALELEFLRAEKVFYAEQFAEARKPADRFEYLVTVAPRCARR